MKTIEQIKADMDATRRRVMKVTGLTDEQVSALVFEAAHEWLAYQGCDDHIALQFASTKEFWGFWKLDVWHKSDIEFLKHQAYYQYDATDARYYYDCFHHVDSSSMNTELAAAGYHSLIKKLAIKR